MKSNSTFTGDDEQYQQTGSRTKITLQPSTDPTGRAKSVEQLRQALFYSYVLFIKAGENNNNKKCKEMEREIFANCA